MQSYDKARMFCLKKLQKLVIAGFKKFATEKQIKSKQTFRTEIKSDGQFTTLDTSSKDGIKQRVQKKNQDQLRYSTLQLYLKS